MTHLRARARCQRARPPLAAAAPVQAPARACQPLARSWHWTQGTATRGLRRGASMGRSACERDHGDLGACSGPYAPFAEATASHTGPKSNAWEDERRPRSARDVRRHLRTASASASTTAQCKKPVSAAAAAMQTVVAVHQSRWTARTRRWGVVGPGEGEVERGERGKAVRLGQRGQK